MSDTSYFGVPYNAPSGYQWQLGSTINGFTVPQLIPTTSGPDPSVPQSVTTIPPQMVITFDTIGQLIYSTFGHARMPLRYLWVQGVAESGQVVTGDTITFAAALCAPIDPLEEGETFGIFDGGAQVFDLVNGITIPANWDPLRAALLVASLATAVIYPGTEGQDPDPTILDDKTAALTPAFAGLRYIVLQDYPTNGGLPNLSTQFNRTNTNSPSTKKKKKKKDDDAVEFLAGDT